VIASRAFAGSALDELLWKRRRTWARPCTQTIFAKKARRKLAEDRVELFAIPKEDIAPIGSVALASGHVIREAALAYRTYGTLNEEKSNAVLVCHALTGDQYVSGINPVNGNPGWWANVAGPGKVIDTDRYFVICSNVLGGCMGSTGPSDINPETGSRYGTNFPILTIGDMVIAQAQLLDTLGVRKLFSVVGASAGGMQALEWAARFGDRLDSVIAIATAAQESARNIAFHEVSRQAIMADPDWCEGRYLDLGKNPARGLAVARMAAHINYLSADKLHDKFGRKLQGSGRKKFQFDAHFQIESYLKHQGLKFVERFDANSYLYLTKAIDLFDLESDYEGNLAQAFSNTQARFCVISFSSDWLQPTEESKKIVRALNANAADVSFVEISTPNGHDAFLLDEPELHNIIEGFLNATKRKREITSL
jgi:homoserine O-acetyltransferase/O-succinyltransferase